MMGLFLRKNSENTTPSSPVYVGGHLIQVIRKVKILFKLSFLSPAAELCDIQCSEGCIYADLKTVQIKASS